MRWPFVARSTYDEVVRQRADWRALQAATDAAYRELIEKYHELVTAPHGANPAPQEKRPVDPVMDAIAVSAGNDGTMRRQLGIFARRARAEGAPEQDIVGKLLNWDDVSDDDSTGWS